MMYLIAGFGGFLGTMLRYFVNLKLADFRYYDFPWATFTVNVVGCALAGLVLFNKDLFENQNYMHPLLIIGFLGGFTTFSAFGMETFYFIEKSNFTMAGINVTANLVFGLGAIALMRMIFPAAA